MQCITFHTLNSAFLIGCGDTSLSIHCPFDWLWRFILVSPLPFWLTVEIRLGLSTALLIGCGDTSLSTHCPFDWLWRFTLVNPLPFWLALEIYPCQSTALLIGCWDSSLSIHCLFIEHFHKKKIFVTCNDFFKKLFFFSLPWKKLDAIFLNLLTWNKRKRND